MHHHLFRCVGIPDINWRATANLHHFLVYSALQRWESSLFTRWCLHALVHSPHAPSTTTSICWEFTFSSEVLRSSRIFRAFSSVSVGLHLAFFDSKNLIFPRVVRWKCGDFTSTCTPYNSITFHRSFRGHPQFGGHTMGEHSRFRCEHGMRKSSANIHARGPQGFI